MNQSVITLKTSHGQLLVGTVRALRADVLTVELEHAVPERSVMEWRMELTGHQETVSGILRVISVRVTPGTELYRVMGQLEGMPPADRTRLNAWMQERQEGGNTRRYNQSVSSGVSTWTTHSQHASVSETNAALARMNRRRQQMSADSDRSDLLGLTSEVKSDAGRETGRQALRDALRQSMARKRRRAATDTGGLPSWARAQQPTGRKPLPDPEVTQIPHTSPPRIRVAYSNPTLYAREYKQNISRYALSIPLPDLGDSGTRLLVSIVPPRREPVTCDAEVKVKMPSGVGVALLLSREQHTALAPKD